MTSTPATDIAVIVVNYGTADLALEAVSSVIDRQHGGRAVEVHIVDNNSPGQDATLLAREIAERGWEDQVTLYIESENHGFGRGNNVVLKILAASATPPRYVFLLNPDARLDNEAIAVLADFLDARPLVAAAGARIYRPGGIPVTAAFRFFGILSTFEDAISFGPISRLLDRWRVPLPPDTPLCQVDWVSGAAAMLRFSALSKVGFFDPNFFLYFEETELMWRLGQGGFQTWHVPEAKVTHFEGAATEVRSLESQRRRLPWYWYDSWQYYFRKCLGRSAALVSAALWLSGAAMHRMICLLRRKQPRTPLHFASDFWNMGIRPLLGLRARRYD